jgi:prepilin-type N-terminal cleavage/methylation domain-containing protein
MTPRTVPSNIAPKPRMCMRGSPTRNSKGFTLIELLVVIGIILVLIGLFFAGAKLVTAQAKTRDTQTALETCKTMFANYLQATHLSRYPAGLSFGPPVNANTWYNAQEAPLGVITPDNLGLQPAPQQLQTQSGTNSTLFTDTAIVFAAMESLPENQALIANIPASKRITALLPNTALQVTLLLDGWGNPIMFVPGGGLGIYPTVGMTTPSGMIWVDGVNQAIITSTGVWAGTTAPNYKPTAVSSNQPFFVSAGPDGSINNYHPVITSSGATDTSASTDDNVYSFNNQ